MKISKRFLLFFSATTCSLIAMKDPSLPVENKEIFDSSITEKIKPLDPLLYFHAAERGPRPTMEDAHAAVTYKDLIYLAIFDGHAGDQTATIAAHKETGLHKYIFNNLAIGQKTKTAITNAFATFDESLTELTIKESGSTAIVALLRKQTKEKAAALYFAILGDSRALLIRNGKVALSTKLSEHSPKNVDEKERILEAGGEITANGRINGVLGVSRAFGDIYLKEDRTKPLVSFEPTILKTKDLKDGDIITLCCDGVTDVIPDSASAAMTTPKTDNPAMQLIQIALQQDKCMDNVSAVVYNVGKDIFETPYEGSSKTKTEIPTTLPSEESEKPKTSPTLLSISVKTAPTLATEIASATKTPAKKSLWQIISGLVGDLTTISSPASDTRSDS